jgi:hypothetical protein
MGIVWAKIRKLKELKSSGAERLNKTVFQLSTREAL